MQSKIRVACAQTGSVGDGEDIGASVERAKTFIDRCAEQGAEIVVFPELFLTPFFANRLRTDTGRFFLELIDARFRALCAHCRMRGVAAILPIAEKHRAAYYNSAVVVDERAEVRGVYRKTHIPAYFPNDKPGGTGSYEKFYFTPGDMLKTFELRGVTFGIQICNDRLYPEASRVLTMAGAHIIFMPISYSTYSRPAERASLWEVPLRARAFENGVYVVAVNRVGVEGERRHLGRSMVVAPDGMILKEASAEDEDVLVVDLDLAAVEEARLNFPWWRDRRPQLYQPLAEPQ